MEPGAVGRNSDRDDCHGFPDLGSSGPIGRYRMDLQMMRGKSWYGLFHWVEAWDVGCAEYGQESRRKGDREHLGTTPRLPLRAESPPPCHGLEGAGLQ